MTLHEFRAVELSRRDFLLASGLALATGTKGLNRLIARQPGAKACIQIMLTGGPSQLETWDPKPAAPANVRGPFGSIATSVPGVRISELLPELARRAERYAILRSITHDAAPIHETGMQLLQTGRLACNGEEWPHFGARMASLYPARSCIPQWLVIKGEIQESGDCLSHGQSSGLLNREFLSVEAIEIHSSGMGLDADLPSTLARYGNHKLGRNCLMARQWIERGARVVTVNMFESLFGQITWDCHANGSDLNSTLQDYRDTLCPMLDQGVSALLDDLQDRGLLESTLVVCMGEFGRTPRLNNGGGRDHWPKVWSGILAGGGVRGGQVIGASDGDAAEPKDRPIHLPEVTASIYHALGISPATLLRREDGRLVRLVDAEPIAEL